MTRKNEKNLKHSYLLSVLDYSPDTGLFTWKISPSFSIKVGDVAGSKGKNYVVISINKETHAAHRLAFFYMTKRWPVEFIDHIDRNKHNNRWSNLREANRAENSVNRKVPSNSSSGVTGVTFYKANGRWRAHIKVKDKKMSLGYFKTLEEAAAARKMAEVKYFGDFSPS